MFRFTEIRWAVAAVLFLTLGALAACSDYSGDTPLPGGTAWPDVTQPDQPTNTPTRPEVVATPSRPERSPTPLVTGTRVAPTVSATPTARVLLATAVPATRVPTVTPAATLSRDQRLALRQQLLDTNGDCRLPCWWGITPGSTAWSAATAFFERLWVHPYPIATPAGDRIAYYEFRSFDDDAPPNYSLLVRMGIQGNAIRALAVRGYANSGGAQIITDPTFAQAWRIYTLRSVLTTYGQPDSINVYVDLTSTCGHDFCSQYVLVLSYPSLGFVVSYYWIDDTWAGGAIVALCPSTRPVHGIDLYLQSPDATDPVQDLLALPDSLFPRHFPDLSDLRSLEGATGWADAAFYQTYSQPGAQACMETPTSLWPHR